MKLLMTSEQVKCVPFEFVTLETEKSVEGYFVAIIVHHGGGGIAECVNGAYFSSEFASR